MNAELASSWLNSLLADAYQPRPEEGVLAWANENVKLTTEVSPEFPGMYGIDISPVTEIIFDFFDSPDWDEFICPKSSQIGLSLAAHVCALYYAKFIGKNIAVCLDSAPEATRVSRSRLQPMIKACPSLASKMREDCDSMNNLTLYLKGLTMFLMGAFSATALANKTIGLGIADEVDNYPASIRGESNGLDLLRDRLKKVVGSKLLAFSKPKNSTDIIWPEYLTGSRHKCFLPCPHCSATEGKLWGYQSLKWKQVKYDHCRDEDGSWDYEKVKSKAFYECVHCRGKITDADKPWMLANREWRATNKGQDQWKPKPRKMSAHVSDLYSLFPGDEWGELVVEFLDARHSLSGRLKFRRGRLGLPEFEKKIEVSSSDIRKLFGGYGTGEIPTAPDCVLMAADVQKDTSKWCKAGFNLDTDDCWVTDYGEQLAYNSLLRKADTPTKVLSWGETKDELRNNPTVYKGLIDEGDGNKRPEIRDFVISTFLGVDENGLPDYRFYSCFGRAGMQTKHWRDQVETLPAEHKAYPLTVYKFDDWAFKKDLYLQRIQGFRQFERAQRDNRPPPAIPRLWFPANCDEDFLAEFGNEEQIFNPKKNRWEWLDPPKGKNDFADALKMILVGYYTLRPKLIYMRQLAQTAALVG